MQAHQRNRLLAALPAKTIELMRSDLRQVSLPQGSVLHEHGEPIEEVYFPQNGLISLVVSSNPGDSIDVMTVGREGAVGLHRGLGPRRAFTRATVQIGGAFSTIRGARFAKIVQNDAPLRDMIARYTELLCAEAQQLTACNAMHDAASRLARLLLQSADRTGSDRVPLTQEFLAQMVGVRRTTVTLLAQAIQKQGLIKYSRGRITILDRPGLEACSCECYHIVRHDKLSVTLGVML